MSKQSNDFDLGTATINEISEEGLDKKHVIFFRDSGLSLAMVLLEGENYDEDVATELDKRFKHFMDFLVTYTA